MKAALSQPDRDELRDLILELSIERRKVVLASGKESDLYVDLRQTLMRPRGVTLAGRLTLETEILQQVGIVANSQFFATSLDEAAQEVHKTLRSKARQGRFSFALEGGGVKALPLEDLEQNRSVVGPQRTADVTGIDRQVIAGALTPFAQRTEFPPTFALQVGDRRTRCRQNAYLEQSFLFHPAR